MENAATPGHIRAQWSGSTIENCESNQDVAKFK
jgi:hypothetical protein